MSKVRLFTDLGDTNSSGGGSSSVMRINQARAQTDTVSASFDCGGANDGTDVPITNLAVTITPNALDSIITLNLSMCGEWTGANAPANAMVSIQRVISDGTTEVIRNTNSGSGTAHQGIQPFAEITNRAQVLANKTTMEICNIHFSDNLGLQTLTSSSTVTYTPVLRIENGGYTSIFYLNRTSVLTRAATALNSETGISSFHAVDDVLSSS